jgi:HEAT repeat protein
MGYRFLAAFMLSLLGFLGACASSGGDKSRSFLPEDPDNMDLRFYVEADENRLYLELDKLLRQWRDASLADNPVVAAGIADQISRYTRANFETIRTGLTSDSPRYRAVAAASLGFSGREEAALPLVTALGDSDEAVLENSLLSLARLSPLSTNANRTLLGLLKHESAWVRSNALLVLGRNLTTTDAPYALEPLLAATRDEDDVVRNNAVGAIARLRTPESIEALAALFDDPYPRIRIRAVVALGEIGDLEAVPSLVPLLDSSSKPLVRAVAHSLREITGEDHGTDREAWQRWWDRHVETSSKEP